MRCVARGAWSVRGVGARGDLPGGHGNDSGSKGRPQAAADDGPSRTCIPTTSCWWVVTLSGRVSCCSIQFCKRRDRSTGDGEYFADTCGEPDRGSAAVSVPNHAVGGLPAWTTALPCPRWVCVVTRVGLITEYFDPEGGSAAIPGFIAHTLVNRGLEVDVLTGFPNYPFGKTIEGHRQSFHAVEMHGRVRVHRVPLIPSHSDRTVSRALTYTSFAVSSTASLGCLSSCDVVLVYSTPVTVGLGPALRRWSKKVPVVTLIEDLWPETLVHSGLAGQGPLWGLAGGWAGRVSDWIYGSSDAVAVISPGMVEALTARGIAREKIHLTYNWIPNRLLPASSEVSLNSIGVNTPRRFIYAGNLGEPQQVESILDAARLLRHREDISFTIVGSGVLESKMRERIRREGLSRVNMLGPRPVEDVPDLVGSCDVQLVTLASDPLFRMTIPSKVQFSLAFGRPIVASLVGDPARVLEASGAALLCRPGDAQSLAGSIARAADLPASELQVMGRAGLEYFRTHFSEEVAGAIMTNLLEAVIADRRR